MSAAARVGSAALDGGSTGPCPEYPVEIESIVGALLWQRQVMPDRIVCRRVTRTRRGIETIPLNVAELVERATTAAARLETLGVARGDRVILSLTDAHDFLVAFFATLIRGATAVPLPTVAETTAPRSFATRVRAACSNCAPRLAIVENREKFVQVVGDIAQLVVVEPSTLALTGASPTHPFTDQPRDSAAFIQYTSGSTGTPKGVVITHGNILANCRAIRDATAYTRADRMVSWLPLHHDMGLIGGLLTSIYCAAETCLMSPLAFLARPVTWLEAISECRGVITVAPTFAYSLCARKIPDKQLTGIDLATLRLAYVGAEPIDPATVDAFNDRFRPYGLAPTAIYPVYGLAEATLAVAFPTPGTAVHRDTVSRTRLARDGVAVPVGAGEPDGVSFISVGHPLPRHRVEIVAPETGERRGEREVGELVASGDSISPGYFGVDATSANRRLHTGDLAYFADGELYVVDRIKDLVIIGGQNYAPSDIENAVAAIPGVRRGRVVAFATPGPTGTEELQIVLEVSPETRQSLDEIRESVQHKIRSDIGLSAQSILLVAPGSLERTSSGKIKRRACADAATSGRLSPLTRASDLWALQLQRQRDLVLYQARAALRGAVQWIRGTRGRHDEPS